MRNLLLVLIVVVFAAPAFGTTIYDIQDSTVATGTEVTVENVVVTAGHGEIHVAYCFVQEPAGGPYSGVQVYWGSGNDSVYAHIQRGDEVTVTGKVEEYYGMTEIDVSGPGGSVLVTNGGDVIDTEIIQMSATNAEEWEGVLVTVECCETYEVDLGFGEWGVQDVTGQGICDDADRLGYTPVLGEWQHYTGINVWAYGGWRIWIRDLDDIVDTEPSATDVSSWGSIKALYR